VKYGDGAMMEWYCLKKTEALGEEKFSSSATLSPTNPPCAKLKSNLVHRDERLTPKRVSLTADLAFQCRQFKFKFNVEAFKFKFNAGNFKFNADNFKFKL
jgi:hypothetical protein